MAGFLNVALGAPNGIFDPAYGDLGAAGCSHIATLAPPGDYNRARPFHLDTKQADATTKATVERYFGWTVAPFASLRTARLASARITGQGAVITRDLRLVRESVTEFIAQGRPPDGLFAGVDDGYRLPDRVDEEVAEPCILVKRPWYANYGHWLVDGATVLALAAQLIAAERLTVVVARCNPLAAVMAETIQRLVPGATVLRHGDGQVWRFASLRYVAPPHLPPLFKSPHALDRLRAAFLPADAAPVRTGRRLFVSRRAAARRLLNEPELMEICKARGFEPVEPAGLTLAEQARLFASAEAVIGAKGAALTNALFCPPGAKVMLLSPADFPDPFFWDLCARRCDYGEVFGLRATAKPAGLNDFTIEPTRLLAMLNAAGL